MFHKAIAVEQRLLAEDAPLELAVIIPTFNEAANVEKLLGLLDEALRGIVWEAIFVDDDSSDGTAELIRSIGRTNIRVRVLQRLGRRGLSTAVIEGMMATSAPVLAVIDADLQHDETLLPRLFAAVGDGGADLAIGSRYVGDGGVGEWDSRRHAASRGATLIAQRILKTELSDPMSGFFAISREALQASLPRISGGGFKILLDIVASAPEQLKVVELPYVFRTRSAGESKLDLMVTAEYLKLVADKAVGHIIPIRLLLFLIVGGIGVAVHLGILGGLLFAGLGFAAAQVGGVWGSMTFNFVLNNIFTYSDRRLRGARFFTGLISFYAVCLVGAAANVGVGTYIHGTDHSWWLAGVAGALMGAVWNFAASSAITWRK